MMLVTLLLSSFVLQLVPQRDGISTSRAISIPLVCDAQKALLVPVSIQGAPPRPFILDTGSSISVIDNHTAGQFRLAPAGRIASTSGSDPLVVAQLTIGTVVLPEAPVATIDARRLSQLLGDIGGILGSDALRAMGRTTIDYANCRLTVGGAVAETGESTRIPLTWHQGRPVIAVGEGARLLLDSGATTVTVFSDTPAAAGLRWSGRLASIVRVDRLDGAKMGRLGELACLSIGGVTLRGIPAVAVNSWYDKRDERAPDGLLPLALFSRVHISHAEGYIVLIPTSRH